MRCWSAKMALLFQSPLLVVLGLTTPTFGHEVRPAYLEITEHSDGRYDVLWKQPTQGTTAVRLVPRISGGFLERAPKTVQTAPDFQITRWRNLDLGPLELEGRTLTIEGLDRTITDAILLIRLSNGDSIEEILNPQSPSLALHLHERRMASLSFLVLGIQHILTGPDHLLFVLGLLLIVRNYRTLLKTVSAFTLAHSLTLAAATLANIHLSTSLLNVLIGSSILFVAPEAVRAQQCGMSLSIRSPWVMAFGFGLLHGMGFATGLTSLGLQRGTLLTALLLFNIGVEVGQLSFIAVVLALKRSFRLMEFVWPRRAELIPAYVIGTLGATWTLKYCAILFGVS